MNAVLFFVQIFYFIFRFSCYFFFLSLSLSISFCILPIFSIILFRLVERGLYMNKDECVLIRMIVHFVFILDRFIFFSSFSSSIPNSNRVQRKFHFAIKMTFWFWCSFLMACTFQIALCTLLLPFFLFSGLFFLFNTKEMNDVHIGSMHYFKLEQLTKLIFSFYLLHFFALSFFPLWTALLYSLWWHKKCTEKKREENKQSNWWHRENENRDKRWWRIQKRRKNDIIDNKIQTEELV